MENNILDDGRVRDRINEVLIGATPKEGGSRNRSVRLGVSDGDGLRTPPVVVLDVFDEVPPLPASVKEVLKDKIEDPVQWARCCVEDFGADMIALELISTNPNKGNRSAEEATETALKVLDAVKVPLMVSGSGDVRKDVVVLPAVAKALAGERCILSSLTLENFKEIAPAAIEHNHAVVAATSLSIDYAISLNRQLMKLGLPPQSIVMDVSTCPLGYGFEYTYSILERMRLQAANVERFAQQPILFCSANSWAAREAKAKVSEWGDWRFRGAAWEMVTAIGGMMAGSDLLLMLHPVAAQELKVFINDWRGSN